MFSAKKYLTGQTISNSERLSVLKWVVRESVMPWERETNYAGSVLGFRNTVIKTYVKFSERC
jgi:hypothetical protein